MTSSVESLERQYRKLVLCTVPWTLGPSLETRADPGGVLARKQRIGRFETDYAFRHLALPRSLAWELVQAAQGDPRVYRLSIIRCDARTCILEERRLCGIDHAEQRVLYLHEIPPGCSSADGVRQGLARWHLDRWRKATLVLHVVRYWRRRR